PQRVFGTPLPGPLPAAQGCAGRGYSPRRVVHPTVSSISPRELRFSTEDGKPEGAGKDAGAPTGATRAPRTAERGIYSAPPYAATTPGRLKSALSGHFRSRRLCSIGFLQSEPPYVGCYNPAFS